MPAAATGRQEEEESATLATTEQPKSSCSTYLAEGDKLFKVGEQKKAIDSYTAALERADTEGIDKRPCYYARALCHLQLGNSELALEDAEECLEDDPSYSKGLWVKAEALYAMGNFEYALMFFHRGCHLRSDNREFQIGIQKSQEAIENAIGEKATGVELTTRCDLAYFYNHETLKKREKKAKPGTARVQPRSSVKKEEPKKKEDQRKKGSKSSRKSSRRLLGELYSDKEYLELLFKDGVVANESSDSGKKIRSYADEALKYLEKREEFWRQQNPSKTHDKPNDRGESGRKSGDHNARVSKKANPAKYVMKQIEYIEHDMDCNDFVQAEKRCKETLNEALVYTEEELPSKQEFLATLYNLYGTALFEQDKFKEAEKQFLNDLDLSETNEDSEGRNRALDNLGRVCAKLGKHDVALRYWNQKLELLDSKKQEPETNGDDEALERIWLYHEIAKCHLDLKCFQESKSFGQKALQLANECGDEGWQLNATIIVAKCEAKLEEYESASTTFEEALELAKSQDNRDAQNSIEKALRDVNQKLSRSVIQQVAEPEGDASRDEGPNVGVGASTERRGDREEINEGVGENKEKREVNENNSKHLGEENEAIHQEEGEAELEEKYDDDYEEEEVREGEKTIQPSSER